MRNRFIADSETISVKLVNEDNSIENTVDNQGYNPYRDSKGRFASGPRKSETSSVVMSEAQAKEAIKDSKLQDKYYHGTSSTNAEKIGQEGFRINEKGDNLYGKGIYFANEAVSAFQYATKPDQKGKTVSAYIDSKNPHSLSHKSELAESVLKNMVNKGVIDSESDLNLDTKPDQIDAWHKSFKEEADKMLQGDTDAILVPPNDLYPQITVVKDPSQIKIFNIDDSRKTMDRFFDERDNS